MNAPSTAVSASAEVEEEEPRPLAARANAATSVHGTQAIAVSAIRNRLSPSTPSE